MELREGDPISVVWLDTHAVVGWTALHEIKTMRPTLVEVRGFFISQDEECMRIAGSRQHNNDMEYSSIDVIPLGVIKEVVNHAQEGISQHN